MVKRTDSIEKPVNLSAAKEASLHRTPYFSCRIIQLILVSPCAPISLRLIQCN